MKKVKTILIIDDNPDILEALEVVLSMEGYHVITVSSEADANKILHTSSDSDPHHINLILLDVLLSGQDGRIIAKNLKSSKKTQQIPIIMMSAHPDVMKTIKASGADDFIPKPFEMDILLSKVKHYTH